MSKEPLTKNHLTVPAQIMKMDAPLATKEDEEFGLGYTTTLVSLIFNPFTFKNFHASRNFQLFYYIYRVYIACIKLYIQLLNSEKCYNDSVE